MENSLKHSIYYKMLGERTRDFFNKHKFYPKNPEEADMFVKNRYKFNSDSPFVISYLDTINNTNESITIDKDNYFEAYYFDIYKSLSKTQLMKVLKWTFDKYSESEVDSSALKFFNYTANGSVGESISGEEGIVINFEYLLMSDLSPYCFLDTIIHELAHKKQEKLANEIIKSNKTDLNCHEKGWLANCSKIIKVLFDEMDNDKDYIKNKSYLEKYNKIKDTDEFDVFLTESYYSCSAEREAYYTSKKHIERLNEYFINKYGNSSKLNDEFDVEMDENDYDSKLHELDCKYTHAKLDILNKFNINLNFLDDIIGCCTKEYNKNSNGISIEFNEDKDIPSYKNFIKYKEKIGNTLCEVIDYFEKSKVPKDINKRNDLVYKDLVSLRNEYFEDNKKRKDCKSANEDIKEK